MARELTPQGFQEPRIAQLIFNSPQASIVWLFVRIYVGWQWFEAGLSKLQSADWVGATAGTSMAGFVNRAMPKAAGAHPDVTGWYAFFLQNVVLPHTTAWSWAITMGEMLVGLGLIVGLFTGFAAFFGGLMNANYLLAGTVSTNPLLFVLATWLVLAWRSAGMIGLDRFVLPLVGVPGQPGKLFKERATKHTLKMAHQH